ncbi:hypothetical protein HBB16_08560 [Pseudonocardia sp. MCCB 268]|nr:hypothetical protein [Pseudonocardia cytotoxica]
MIARDTIEEESPPSPSARRSCSGGVMDAGDMFSAARRRRHPGTAGVTAPP